MNHEQARNMILEAYKQEVERGESVSKTCKTIKVLGKDVEADTMLRFLRRRPRK